MKILKFFWLIATCLALLNCGGLGKKQQAEVAKDSVSENGDSVDLESDQSDSAVSGTVVSNPITSDLDDSENKNSNPKPSKTTPLENTKKDNSTATIADDSTSNLPENVTSALGNFDFNICKNSVDGKPVVINNEIICKITHTVKDNAIVKEKSKGSLTGFEFSSEFHLPLNGISAYITGKTITLPTQMADITWFTSSTLFFKPNSSVPSVIEFAPIFILSDDLSEVLDANINVKSLTLKDELYDKMLGGYKKTLIDTVNSGEITVINETLINVGNMLIQVFPIN